MLRRDEPAFIATSELPMTRMRFLLASLGLLAACWCAAGRAADEPTKAEPPKSAKLTTAALGEMLTNMGYEPKLADKKYHTVMVESNRRSWQIWVSVENDGRVQLLGAFALRDDFEKAPADAWRNLVEKNTEISPAAFAFEKKYRRLTLKKPLAGDITPALLRKEFTAFADIIDKTEALWHQAAFLPPHTPAAQKLLDELAGSWVLTAASLSGKAAPAENVGKLSIAIEKNEMRFVEAGQEPVKCALYLVVGDGPVVLDMINPRGTDLGILKLDKDTLTICYVTPASKAARPTEFVSAEKDK